MSERTVSEKEAGRELDAEVAERMMGATWAPSESGVPTEEALTFLRSNGRSSWSLAWRYGDGRPVAYKETLPSYSTDIADAWLVVTEMARRGWKVDVQNRYSGCYACHVNFPAHLSYAKVFEKAARLFDAKGATDSQLAALAICRAALAALNALADASPSPVGPTAEQA